MVLEAGCTPKYKYAWGPALVSSVDSGRVQDSSPGGRCVEASIVVLTVPLIVRRRPSTHLVFESNSGQDIAEWVVWSVCAMSSTI